MRRLAAPFTVSTHLERVGIPYPLLRVSLEFLLILPRKRPCPASEIASGFHVSLDRSSRTQTRHPDRSGCHSRRANGNHEAEGSRQDLSFTHRL